MFWDHLGDWSRTNQVIVKDGSVSKKFNRLYRSSLWGFLEHKPFQGAEERYTREKRLVREFWDAGLHTPELLTCNDPARTLEFRAQELVPFTDVFADPNIQMDAKLEHYRDALLTLRSIHALEETHGDPYLKNFFQRQSETAALSTPAILSSGEKEGMPPLLMSFCSRRIRSAR